MDDQQALNKARIEHCKSILRGEKSALTHRMPTLEDIMPKPHQIEIETVDLQQSPGDQSKPWSW